MISLATLESILVFCFLFSFSEETLVGWLLISVSITMLWARKLKQEVFEAKALALFKKKIKRVNIPQLVIYIISLLINF